ncbi:hypothetical protein EVAR_9726_1 [Eumeta japonica]|uniref:Uncharacterized protein n=1 Tax=Eumeta variegata TaxID=151549 RepID=A0A4C1U577_EUMVA|nr:hypothetical protein EVAR_9726_1 [Eumeta japonica]
MCLIKRRTHKTQYTQSGAVRRPAAAGAAGARIFRIGSRPVYSLRARCRNNSLRCQRLARGRGACLSNLHDNFRRAGGGEVAVVDPAGARAAITRALYNRRRVRIAAIVARARTITVDDRAPVLR